MTASGVVAEPLAQGPMQRALRRIGKGARRVAEALATPLLPEDFLDLVAPLHSGADLRGRVVDVRPEGPGATTITITPGRGWRGHRPGQYTRIRQMLGSANIYGSDLFHILTGNLSHQIEHHPFPDMPSNRYAQVAPRVRALMERSGLRYVTGPLPVQVASTWRPRRAAVAAG